MPAPPTPAPATMAASTTPRACMPWSSRPCTVSLQKCWSPAQSWPDWRADMRATLLTCLLMLPALAAADGLPTSPYVQVTGRGELQVTPDMLRLSLTLEKTG